MVSILSSYTYTRAHSFVHSDEVIDTGLLYYSQSNQIFRVQAARNEIRSLLITRNQFATFLHRRMHLSRTSDKPKKYKKKQEEDEDEFDEYFTPEIEVEQPLLMPEPIDSERDCKWCYASDACMLFRKVSSAISKLNRTKIHHLNSSVSGCRRRQRNLSR